MTSSRPSVGAMHIGTPLSPTATRVMLLGAGELGKEVIIALQRLGVETIAVDRYANAPGHQVAHRAHVIAMTDGAALKRLIEQERPHIIVPEIEAIATDALVDIEHSGIAEVIPTARAAQLTMNREGIRRLAAETLGLPTSRYRFAGNLDELNEAIAGDRRRKGIGYPCVVKPVMSSSGKGQSLVRAKDERGRRMAIRRERGPRARQDASSSRASSTSTTRSRCSPCAPARPTARSRRDTASRSATSRCMAITSNRGSRSRCRRRRSRRRARSPDGSPASSAVAACSAWSCSSRAIRSGSPK